ncbi:MAG: ABC transporter ATPase, partial [Polaribacter sp.]
MFTAYKNLPNNSRVWVYQSDREFNPTEIEFISEKAVAFINQWTRHGDDLKGSFTIKYNRFLVLAVDESFNPVSGCSIDSSVHFIRQLENELQLDLMNKMNITFKNKKDINLVKLTDFQN